VPTLNTGWQQPDAHEDHGMQRRSFLMHTLCGACAVAGTSTALAATASEYSSDIRIHDPVLIRENGTYYLFGTGQGITVYSSKDMRSWKKEPAVFDAPPPWAASVVAGFQGRFWAPDISLRQGTYYLYYCVSAGGKIPSASGRRNTTLDRSSAISNGWIPPALCCSRSPIAISGTPSTRN
jgi:beta-xylosidase